MFRLARSWPDPGVQGAPEGCSVKKKTSANKLSCNIVSQLSYEVCLTLERPVYDYSIANTVE